MSSLVFLLHNNIMYHENMNKGIIFLYFIIQIYIMILSVLNILSVDFVSREIFKHQFLISNNRDKNNIKIISNLRL